MPRSQVFATELAARRSKKRMMQMLAASLALLVVALAANAGLTWAGARAAAGGPRCRPALPLRAALNGCLCCALPRPPGWACVRSCCSAWHNSSMWHLRGPAVPPSSPTPTTHHPHPALAQWCP